MDVVAGAAGNLVEIIEQKITRFNARRFVLGRARGCRVTIDLTGANGGASSLRKLQAVAECMERNPALWDGYMPCWAALYGKVPVAGRHQVALRFDAGSFGDYQRAAFLEEHVVVGMDRPTGNSVLIRRRFTSSHGECGARVTMIESDSDGELIRSEQGEVQTKTDDQGRITLEGNFFADFTDLTINPQGIPFEKGSIIDALTRFCEPIYDQIGRERLRVVKLGDSRVIHSCSRRHRSS